MDLWRISNHHSLSGEGGRRYSARWHSAGAPIVYLAASPAGALLEVMVHLELRGDDLPTTYTLLRVAVPESLHIPALRLPRGEQWKEDLALTRRIGSAWLASKRSALARVPSVILPHTFNYLLNPLHPDASRLRITEKQPARFDPRLFDTLHGPTVLPPRPIATRPRTRPGSHSPSR